MTMNFETVKASIINNILGPSEAGNFQTIGFQRQASAGSEVLDNLRFVQVFYSSGNMPKRGGRIIGAVQHEATYRIECTVSKAAEGDVSVLDNPSSTAPQLAAALSNFNEASALADTSLDEVMGIVYQILMDGENYDLGVTKGTVADRWVSNWFKNAPLPRGGLIVLTGSMELTVKIDEPITGLTGSTVNATIFDNEIDIDGDDVEETAVTVDNT